MHLLCPHCKNPIELVKLDLREEITCTSCGSSFRIDEGSTTGWVDHSAKSIGRFSITETVGHGGFGTVFKAHDPELDRTVAVKVPRRGNVGEAPQDVDRFLREARSVAQLRHPSIVSVHEVGMMDGTPYLVSDFVEGLTLSDVLTARRPAPREAAKLIADVADALEHAHQQGVVHRDVKPSNIMVRPDGSPVVMDFGLAKRDAGEITMTMDGQVLGTPAYMSPEQARGEGHRVDGRSDIYSLGVVLYLLMTGELPFRGNARMLLHQVLHDEPKPPRSLNDKIPRDLETITLKAMAKEPANRYVTAADLASDLQRFLGSKPIVARPVGSIERAAKWVKRNPVISAATVAVVLALAAGTTGSYLKYRDAEAARHAESKRVEERDEALARELQRITERDSAIGKRDVAIKAADERTSDLKYQLGVSNMVLASNAYDNRDMKVAAERLDLVPQMQRGWEWHYLKRQTRGAMFTLYGHTNEVTAASFSPDGARIVTGSADHTASIWDARTGLLLVELRAHNSELTNASFNRDGTRIVTSSLDRTAIVWDARTGAPMIELKGHTKGVQAAAFSPDGMRVVTGSDDKTARLWDARTGAPLVELKGHTSRVKCVSFSPDGRRVLTGSADTKANLWDALSGALLIELKGHTSEVSGASFSPDGARIITGSHPTARTWDALTGLPLTELKGDAETIYGVSFSPDGRRVITGGLDQTARVWDSRTGLQIVELKGHAFRVNSVSFSPDGTRVVTGSADKTAKVWDAQTGSPFIELIGHTNHVSSVSFSPDGKRVVTASLDNTARVWEARTGSPLVELKGHTGPVWSVSFSPDGASVVTGSDDRTASVWDARTGSRLVQLRGHTNCVNSVSFSPNGTRVITGSGDGTARIWDAQSGDLKVELKGHTNWVKCASFSPDGERIVTGSFDQTVKLWDARTGKPVGELKDNTGIVSSVSFSPDGKRIVASIDDRTASVWDAQTGMPLVELNGHTSLVECAAFSPDGTRVATGSMDQTAKVWDTQTGSPLIALKGHMSVVRSLSFSPDGTRIVTGSWDHTARIWDARISNPTVKLYGHAGLVPIASFSADGARVVTGGHDKTAKIWNARTGSLLLELRGHENLVSSVIFSPDGSRVLSGSWDKTAAVWDAWTGTRLLELKGHSNWVRCVSFSPDGTRIVTGSQDNTAKVWDARTGKSILELEPHNGPLWSVAYSLDGTRIVTHSFDDTAKVWDALTGQLLANESIPKSPPTLQISSDGKLISYPNGNCVELIPLAIDSEEFDYRLIHTRPNYWRYQHGLDASYRSGDLFAAQFYLDRLLSMPTQRTTERFEQRNGFRTDPRLAARASFHHDGLTKTPYDRGTVQAMAISGDRLAKRLVAQECLREGKPKLAIPLLYYCLLTRPITDPPKPPVEELLLSLAYRETNQLDDAKRLFRAATDWLDHSRNPMRAANIVTHAINPWTALNEAFKPIDDPRHNSFDWESWHECDVFRAKIDRLASTP